MALECLLSLAHLNVLGTLAADIILLLIMSFGLLRLGFHERSASGLRRLMRKQGLIWLLVATIAEVFPTVFIGLNLNDRFSFLFTLSTKNTDDWTRLCSKTLDPFNYMFLPPSMVTLSIAITQIHRNLVEHPSVRRNEQLSEPHQPPRK